MKKIAVVTACLAALMMFLPSQLPAPGMPTFDVLKTCVMEGEQWYYKIVVTNTNTYNLPILVTAHDGGAQLFTNQEVLPGQPFTFEYGHSSSCPASANTVEVTSIFTNPAYSYTSSGSSTARCTCIGDGCTLTWGFWKTHSKYGPAPYAATWDLLDEDATFFLSTLTYHQTLWEDPGGRNAYYILAHQYIAAVLNKLKGASVPQGVADAITGAEALFNQYTPGQVSQKSAGAIRAQFVYWAEILDNYNNGQLGPEHCDAIVR